MAELSRVSILPDWCIKRQTLKEFKMSTESNDVMNHRPRRTTGQEEITRGRGDGQGGCYLDGQGI